MLIDTTLYFNGALRLSRAYRQGTNTLTNVDSNEQLVVGNDLVVGLVNTLDDYADPDALVNVDGAFFTPTPGYTFAAVKKLYVGQGS